MAHKFCGKTQEEMKQILYFMCDIEDETELTEEEQDMFDIAIQCVALVANRMNDDRPIVWDDE